jgi:hypothetical protein
MKEPRSLKAFKLITINSVTLTECYKPTLKQETALREKEWLQCSHSQGSFACLLKDEGVCD